MYLVPLSQIKNKDTPFFYKRQFIFEIHHQNKASLLSYLGRNATSLPLSTKNEPHSTNSQIFNLILLKSAAVNTKIKRLYIFFLTLYEW